MPDYTCDMFVQDHGEMLPVLKWLRHVKLSAQEWPIVCLTPKEMQEACGMTSGHLRGIINKLKKEGLLTEIGDIGGTEYRVCPNDAVADTIGFFRTKYGQSKGRDYATRFLSIVWFINDHRDALIEEGLIRDDESGGTMIREELIRVILDSFSPPKPPMVFPTSTFEENRHLLSVPKVLEAVKPLLQK